ncbi:MAG: ABC transporter ATP-binding protein [Propionibacteriaceae bacterium]|jgi:ABC-type lipoprotein export system ATPase subunit|nr:ABC transporter ATP-binding protein [Propionibacteriaceae bacterium]
MRSVILEARALAFSYRSSDEQVLKDVNASFGPGEVTSVVGPSGCGKSTLLYVLAGLLTPGAGQVWLDGSSFSGLRDGQRSAIRASQIGFVFQDAMLDPSRSVVDNACESAVFSGIRRQEARPRARELLATMGVENRDAHRPGEISGGQAQRVAVCRALLPHPRIVFADEPTGNLDPGSAEVVWAALRGAADRGCCVVVATHSPLLARESDQIIDLSPHSLGLPETTSSNNESFPSIAGPNHLVTSPSDDASSSHFATGPTPPVGGVDV